MSMVLKVRQWAVLAFEYSFCPLVVFGSVVITFVARKHDVGWVQTLFFSTIAPVLVRVEPLALVGVQEPLLLRHQLLDRRLDLLVVHDRSPYVRVYSGPLPPSGGVRRPPLAVIAPHCTQLEGLTRTVTVPLADWLSSIS